MATRIRVQHFIVCDDIRREDNGKIILTGVYSSDMVVFDIPTLLPKLSFYFVFNGLPSEPNTATLRVYSSRKKVDREGQLELYGAPKDRSNVVAFALSPFVVEEAGRYTVLLKFESGEKIRRGFRVRLEKREEWPLSTQPET